MPTVVLSQKIVQLLIFATEAQAICHARLITQGWLIGGNGSTEVCAVYLLDSVLYGFSKYLLVVWLYTNKLPMRDFWLVF